MTNAEIWEQMMDRFCAKVENAFSETQEYNSFLELMGKLLDGLPEKSLPDLGRYDRQRTAFLYRRAWLDCVSGLKQLGALA